MVVVVSSNGSDGGSGSGRGGGGGRSAFGGSGIAVAVTLLQAVELWTGEVVKSPRVDSLRWFHRGVYEERHFLEVVH
ncbi:Protein of unknown function, partial [Gryllus bimaculatus]